jgi:hypothetical protein
LFFGPALVLGAGLMGFSGRSALPRQVGAAPKGAAWLSLNRNTILVSSRERTVLICGRLRFGYFLGYRDSGDFIKLAANADMRKRLIYKSISGNPVLNGDSVELNFITDPVFSADDVTVEMSISELERLHRRISDRLSRQTQS